MDQQAARSVKEKVIVFLKGMAMGVADSVPGVSGGTIAVMAGIYEELVSSLKNLNPLLVIKVFWKEGPVRAWQFFNGNFLLVLLLGILASLYLSAGAVLLLLDSHYPHVMGFFCGLVMASTWFLQKQIAHWQSREWAFLSLGFGITLLTSLLNPLAGDYSLVYLFFCGLVAICAMILPGISGAYILILLGVYDYVLQALRNLQLDVILVFASGCAIGLLSFSHLLSWTFHYYRQQTYAFLTGMLAASIVVLWPWKYHPGGATAPQLYLSPGAFETMSGKPAEILQVALLMIVGYVLVAIFARITRSHR